MIDREPPSTIPGQVLSGEMLRPPEDASPLRGPIPISWLAAAARLPGRSLHVGLALWYAAGLLESYVVPLGNTAARAFGLDRNAKYRGLSCLEKKGLVAVERKLGRAPTVTLLIARPDDD